MAVMNISLPQQLKDWVETQASSGRYANTSDFMRDLIRREQERQEKLAAMQFLVREGLESGPGGRTVGEIKEEARAQAAKVGGRGV